MTLSEAATKAANGFWALIALPIWLLRVALLLSVGYILLIALMKFAGWVLA